LVAQAAQQLAEASTAAKLHDQAKKAVHEMQSNGSLDHIEKESTEKLASASVALLAAGDVLQGNVAAAARRAGSAIETTVSKRKRTEEGAGSGAGAAPQAFSFSGQPARPAATPAQKNRSADNGVSPNNGVAGGGAPAGPPPVLSFGQQKAADQAAKGGGDGDDAMEGQ
jgi:hypothetical protein